MFCDLKTNKKEEEEKKEEVKYNGTFTVLKTATREIIVYRYVCVKIHMLIISQNC